MKKSPIETMLDNVDWAPIEIVYDQKKVDATIPVATHSGVLVIADIRIKCWRLNTGQAVIDFDSLESLFPGWRNLFQERTP